MVILTILDRKKVSSLPYMQNQSPKDTPMIRFSNFPLIKPLNSNSKPEE